MSEVFAEVVAVDWVKPHPAADRLDIAIVKGAQTVVGKGTFAKGDRAIFFPPDLLLTGEAAERVGVTKYLKHAIYPGQLHRTQCRVAACRLRGERSYGFLVPCRDALAIGSNVNELFGATKFEPPARFVPADCLPPCALFHQYTGIEHFWRFSTIIEPGEPVRITEKIHGTNSRVGTLLIDGEYQYVAGSHRTNRKKLSAAGNLSTYWLPLEDPRVLELLADLCDGQRNVIVFGEIFGAGVQDMDYAAIGVSGYRVFDISVNGSYLPFADLKWACRKHDVPMVPILYEGPFNRQILDDLTDGPTTVCPPGFVNSTFRGREGVVVTPQVERFHAACGRVIFKSVSVDYLDRKDAKDEE